MQEAIDRTYSVYIDGVIGRTDPDAVDDSNNAADFHLNSSTLGTLNYNGIVSLEDTVTGLTSETAGVLTLQAADMFPGSITATDGNGRTGIIRSNKTIGTPEPVTGRTPGRTDVDNGTYTASTIIASGYDFSGTALVGDTTGNDGSFRGCTLSGGTFNAAGATLNMNNTFNGNVINLSGDLSNQVFGAITIETDGALGTWNNITFATTGNTTIDVDTDSNITGWNSTLNSNIAFTNAGAGARITLTLTEAQATALGILGSFTSQPDGSQQFDDTGDNILFMIPAAQATPFTATVNPSALFAGTSVNFDGYATVTRVTSGGTRTIIGGPTLITDTNRGDDLLSGLDITDLNIGTDTIEITTTGARWTVTRTSITSASNAASVAGTTADLLQQNGATDEGSIGTITLSGNNLAVPVSGTASLSGVDRGNKLISMVRQSTQYASAIAMAGDTQDLVRFASTAAVPPTVDISRITFSSGDGDQQSIPGLSTAGSGSLSTTESISAPTLVIGPAPLGAQPSQIRTEVDASIAAAGLPTQDLVTRQAQALQTTGRAGSVKPSVSQGAFSDTDVPTT